MSQHSILVVCWMLTTSLLLHLHHQQVKINLMS